MTFGSTFGRVFSPSFQPKSQAAAAGGVFTPTDITGLELWYDFSDATTLFTDAGSTNVSADGDLVYRAYDKSGNGKYIQQTTESKRPIFTLNYMNGLPVINFAETTHVLYASTQLVKLAKTTVFLALTPKYTNTYAGYFIGQMTDSSKSRLENYSYKIRGATQTSTAVITNNYPFTVNNNCIFCLKYDGSKFSFYVNGIDKTYGSADATGEFWIQKLNHNCKFYAAEWIAYDSYLSESDRGNVETYLNNKWAIY